MGWLPLRGCSVIEANLAVGLLEEAGFQARVVDGAGIEYLREHLAPVDYQVIVEVRDDEFGSASAFLDDALPTKQPRTNSSDHRRTESRAPGAESVAALGRRIRYCALSPFAPFGLWLGSEYWSRTRTAVARPREHGWNLAGIAACVPASFFYAFALHEIFSS